MQNDIPVVHMRTFTQDEQKAFQEMKDLLKRLNSAPSIDVEVPSVMGTDGYTEPFINANFRYDANRILYKYFPEEMI